MIQLAPDQALGASKPVDTPACTTAREMTEDEKVGMEGAAASQFRRLPAKLNCLCLDPPDIRFGTSSSKPRVGDMIRLKKIATFLVGKPP